MLAYLLVLSHSNRPAYSSQTKHPLKLVLCVLACVCVRACLRTHYFCFCLAFLRLISLSSLFRLFLPPVRLFLPSHTFTPYSEFALRSIAVPQQSNCPSLLMCPPIVLPFQRFLSQSYIWFFCLCDSFSCVSLSSLVSGVTWLHGLINPVCLLLNCAVRYVFISSVSLSFQSYFHSIFWVRVAPYDFCTPVQSYDDYEIMSFYNGN